MGDRARTVQLTPDVAPHVGPVRRPEAIGPDRQRRGSTPVANGAVAPRPRHRRPRVPPRGPAGPRSPSDRHASSATTSWVKPTDRRRRGRGPGARPPRPRRTAPGPAAARGPAAAPEPSTGSSSATTTTSGRSTSQPSDWRAPRPARGPQRGRRARRAGNRRGTCPRRRGPPAAWSWPAQQPWLRARAHAGRASPSGRSREKLAIRPWSNLPATIGTTACQPLESCRCTPRGSRSVRKRPDGSKQDVVRSAASPALVSALGQHPSVGPSSPARDHPGSRPARRPARQPATVEHDGHQSPVDLLAALEQRGLAVEHLGEHLVEDVVEADTVGKLDERAALGRPPRPAPPGAASRDTG